METQLREITPEMANTWLSHNASNRRISDAQVDALTRAINDGQWRVTHQGIALYEDGTIADGQHRLLAIVKSGVPCNSLVTFGIKKDVETSLAIDAGRMRTVTDGSAISGIKISARDAAMAIAMEFGFALNRPRLTMIEKVRLVEKHRATIDLAMSAMPTNTASLSIAPVRVAVGEAIRDGVDLALATEFCSTLRTGEYTKPAMVNAVRLRNALLSRLYSPRGWAPKGRLMTRHALESTARGVIIKRLKKS